MEIEESVIAKIKLRRDAGRKKYGTSMERSDLTIRQWLVHAQEEAMDLAIYLEKLIQTQDKFSTESMTIVGDLPTFLRCSKWEPRSGVTLEDFNALRDRLEDTLP